MKEFIIITSSSWPSLSQVKVSFSKVDITSRSNLPALLSAPSTASGRLVAPITTTGGIGAAVAAGGAAGAAGDDDNGVASLTAGSTGPTEALAAAEAVAADAAEADAADAEAAAAEAVCGLVARASMQVKS
jgi:hypothetical protein